MSRTSLIIILSYPISGAETMVPDAARNSSPWKVGTPCNGCAFGAFPESMNPSQDKLTEDIERAARSSFSELLTRHGDETFYAFALYTDESCFTVLPAANSLEQYHACVQRMDATEPQERAAYKWSSAEWAYECFAAPSFDGICEQLRERASMLPGDPVTFATFKAEVHHAMTVALRRLDDGGFFGERRAGLVLFITSSDDEEAQELEEVSARALNPPAVYEAFRRRYAVDGCQ